MVNIQYMIYLISFEDFGSRHVCLLFYILELERTKINFKYFNTTSLQQSQNTSTHGTDACDYCYLA